MLNKEWLIYELKSFARTFLATFIVDYAFIINVLYTGEFSDITLHAILIAICKTSLKTIGVLTQPFLLSLKNNYGKQSNKSINS